MMQVLQPDPRLMEELYSLSNNIQKYLKVLKLNIYILIGVKNISRSMLLTMQ
jgi:hypothetical protein